MREPLVQFLLIGAVLFAVYSYRTDTGANTPANDIRLTLDDLAQLELVFESKWYRQPTPDEFQNMVEDRIREEILYREALAMGLDDDDTIVRRRMAQKMKFLAQDVATAREPTREELRTWFAEHDETFALPGRVSFRHLYFSPDRRGERALDDAQAALERLAGHPRDAASAEAIADPFMFRDYYGDRSSGEIAREFGPQFAQAVVRLPAGAWQGPIESGYGWHLVFVDAVVPGRVPTFEEVESDVKTVWLGEQKEAAWQAAYDEMRAKYTVSLPKPPEETEVVAQGGGAPAP